MNHLCWALLAMLSLSVIIPALDEEANIARTVASACGLGAQEAIVADGGSRDRTVALAESAGARIVCSRPGRGVQMNAGAAASTGEVLLFLHADNRLPPEAGQQIAEALDDPSTVHGAFRQQIDAVGIGYRWLEAGNAFRARRLGTPYGDQALFVRRWAFDRVGGFPDEPLMEDVAIARGLRTLGRPALAAGPLRVSPRRWREHGVVGQTAKNWALLAAWNLGVSPQTLARWYKPPRSRSADERPLGEPLRAPAGAATESSAANPPQPNRGPLTPAAR